MFPLVVDWVGSHKMDPWTTLTHRERDIQTDRHGHRETDTPSLGRVIADGRTDGWMDGRRRTGIKEQ